VAQVMSALSGLEIGLLPFMHVILDLSMKRIANIVQIFLVLPNGSLFLVSISILTDDFMDLRGRMLV
jgi:hypothetical protein